MSETLKETIPIAEIENLPYSIPLEIKVEDRDTIRSLVEYPEGPQRDDYALEALKIGVLALRHAAGALDTDFIQRETTRLVETLGHELETHTRQANNRLAGSLKEYFDPEDGRFSQRVKLLTSDDGDLSRMLRSMFDGDNSQLAKTLLSHFGQTSPIMKMLDPNQSQGLFSKVRDNVDQQLKQNQDRLLKEFSLDNPEGALRRLTGELTSKHGDFTKDMQSKIDEVVKEFSLDEENSALSRLVSNVDSAQKRITQEFSLDNKQSALHKLKEELLTILSAHVDSNVEFQTEVKVALGKLVTKREVEASGTQHGDTFEESVYAFLAHNAEQRGDFIEATGNKVGLIKNRKFGDAVLELGPDCIAEGAKIVIEAKEDASYTLQAARDEIELARKNRGAQFGIFVFSKRTAPAHLKSFSRYGNDLIMVWDAEDLSTDTNLVAALELGRALCVRTRKSTKEQIDFTLLDKVILEIEKRTQNLGEIHTSAQTIINSSESILNRVRIDKKALIKQIEILRASIGDLKHSVTSDNN